MPAGNPATVVVVALALDALIGDPDVVWRRLPHPAAWMGSAIALLDRILNNERSSGVQRRIAGCVAIVTLVSASFVAGLVIERALGESIAGLLAQGLIASIFIAQRSLYQHVDRVLAAFAADGLRGARQAVSMIVGRETGQLDASGVSRAAIESCAENFSDGVVAPVFWLAMLGLPGLLVYKAVNTADSMIGHRTLRHDSFGWAAARFDDLLNFVPARLAALILALVSPVAGGSVASSLKIVWRDASMHRSPNAGWPESAMAGALGLALAGPRQYGDKVVNDPFLNADGRLIAEPADIRRALNVLIAGCLLEAVAYAALALVV